MEPRYGSYTDVLLELLKSTQKKTVLEIGPGLYVFPYASLALLGEVDYTIADVAENQEEAYDLNFQFGGLSDYVKELQKIFPQLKPPKAVNLAAHEIEKAGSSYGIVLINKTLWKFLDIFLSSNKKFREKVQEFEKKIRSYFPEAGRKEARKLYVPYVLYQAGRISEYVAVIPEAAGDFYEKPTEKMMEVIFPEVQKIAVEKPYWKISTEQGIKYAKHWQDNTATRVYVGVAKDKKELYRRFLGYGREVTRE